jgi:hypothetical protein
VQFQANDQMPQSIILDTEKLESLAGPCTVDWRDGFRRMVSALHPEFQLK